MVLDEGVVRIYTLFSPCPSPPREGASRSEAFDGLHPIEATSTSYYTHHPLGQEATDTGLTGAQIWSTGLVALTSAGRLVYWRFPPRAGDEPQFGATLRIAQPQLLPSWEDSSTASNQVASWTVVPPESSSSGTAQVLVSPASGQSMICVDAAGDTSDMKLARGPYPAIRPSSNGKLLALVTADWKLWVVSSDFERSLSEFDLTQCSAFKADSAAKASATPSNSQHQAQNRVTLFDGGIRQVEWCGNNTVAVAWESEVVMVGPFGDSIRYFYPGPMHMISELDGLRIVSSDRLEFVQKVSDAAVSIFLPGSTHVGAILFDSAEQFAKKSAKADEGIRAIRRDLDTAVHTCLMAAGQEWDVTWQRKLMRSASFGRSFLDNFDPTILVDTAHTLRVLNAARRYDVGLPITYDQYQEIGPAALLRRLTHRNHHLLCLHISSYLDLRPDPVLKHWALSKVARSRPGVGALAQGMGTNSAAARADDETCRAIVAKLELQPSVSFADIARSAWSAGRTQLATKLLDYEPRAVDQVPLLLTMHEDKLALTKAIESGDTDLVYHVLLRLKSQLSRGDFFRIVQAPIADASAPTKEGGAPTRPSPSSHVYLAKNLLEVYAMQEDVELLKDFYYQDDRRTEAALLALGRAEAEADVSAKVQYIKEAQRLFSEDKERTLEAKVRLLDPLLGACDHIA